MSAATLAPLLAGGGGGGGGFSSSSSAKNESQTSQSGAVLGAVNLGGFKLPKIDTPVQYGILAIGALGLFYMVVKGRK